MDFSELQAYQKEETMYIVLRNYRNGLKNLPDPSHMEAIR